MSHSTLLEINAVKKYFTVGKQTFVKAVDSVTFSLRTGQTLGLVGESGCGKSTIGRCILRLYGVTGGEILFENQNIDTYRRKERLNYCRNVQSVFQDPYGSLNPRMQIEEIINEEKEIADQSLADLDKARVFQLKRKGFSNSTSSNTSSKVRGSK